MREQLAGLGLAALRTISRLPLGIIRDLSWPVAWVIWVFAAGRRRGLVVTQVRRRHPVHFLASLLRELSLLLQLRRVAQQLADGSRPVSDYSPNKNQHAYSPGPGRCHSLSRKSLEGI